MIQVVSGGSRGIDGRGGGGGSGGFRRFQWSRWLRVLRWSRVFLGSSFTPDSPPQPHRHLTHFLSSSTCNLRLCETVIQMIHFVEKVEVVVQVTAERPLFNMKLNGKKARREILL